MFVSSGTMAVPPAYADLGKSAKDIFNKGYGNSANSLKYELYYSPEYNWKTGEAMLKQD